MKPLEAAQLLQQIVQSPAPPANAIVVVLSARDEDAGESYARCEHAKTIPSPKIVLHADAANTYEEAIQALRWATRGQDVVIVTSAYHQLRAFLTFVKVFHGTGVRLWNAPAPSGWEKLEGEMAKIPEYHAKGHLASYRDGLDHLAWRESYHCAGAT